VQPALMFGFAAMIASLEKKNKKLISVFFFCPLLGEVHEFTNAVTPNIAPIVVQVSPLLTM
jgi:Na+-translocating ferredoxin:NAD+ oxidoreductase RnfE subunit